MNAVGSRSSRALLLGMVTLYPSCGRVPLSTCCLQLVRELQALAGDPGRLELLARCLVVIWIVWFLSVISALLTWPWLMRLTIWEVSTCW